MKTVIQGRKPASVFRFFEEICAIPHPSHHEEKIAAYLVDFAESRGLEYYTDGLHNVLIKSPATEGREAEAPILFQGHTDMVCEKNGDVVHDFFTDPLKLFTDGNLLGARGTTLGGDDGIAVAMMLALLDGEIPSHPAMECLFTVAEETGMNGAQGFDYSGISARRMVNMDSEELGVITAGCAGGIRTDLTLTAQTEPFAGEALRISVTGLMGGHSGENINSGRANANKLMGRVLAELLSGLPEAQLRLVGLCGGSKDNAIPRECTAVVSVKDAEAVKAVITMLQKTEKNLQAELSEADHAFRLTVERERASDAPARMFTGADTKNAVAVLACAANGVLEMNRLVEGLVEYSRNLGVVETSGETVRFVFSARSAKESRLDASTAELDLLAAVTGCKTRHYSRYPGWDFAEKSQIRSAYLAAYRDVTGQDATVNVIHAGLECGLISSRIPDMDIISVGPTMHDIHSPNERLDLASTEIFWKTIVRLMELL